MGIDLSTLSDPPIPPEDYLNTNFPPEKFIVGYAGTVGITNALDNFFQCAQSLVNNDHILFVLIGDGDLKARYVKEFGHLPNLIFAPKVPKQMVQAVLSHCDLLYFSVYNSEVWRYGQSLNKITDYMLAGKPIIASYNGFPSMINEAGCGSYLPTSDIAALQKEILRYFSMSPNERKRIGDLGRSWILENRSYKILSKNYIDIVFPQK
jgi:glycosyltransferase involved in cell wall biosynthesis